MNKHEIITKIVNCVLGNTKYTKQDQKMKDRKEIRKGILLAFMQRLETLQRTVSYFPEYHLCKLLYIAIIAMLMLHRFWQQSGYINNKSGKMFVAQYQYLELMPQKTKGKRPGCRNEYTSLLIKTLEIRNPSPC